MANTQARPRRAPEKAAPDAFGGGVRLGRIFGVEVYLAWSLLIIFALIFFNLGAGVFPRWHPQWSGAAIWGTAFAAAVSFFASVLAHELSHAVVGRMQGAKIHRITLFIFGGATQLEGEPRSPRGEFAMAIVGPLTSLAIGALATWGGWTLAQVSMTAFELDPQSVLARLGPAATLLLWLGPLNVLLGLFNLVPGFPLDGGRVLRSLLWWVSNDFLKATRWAALVGQGVSVALMAYGVFRMFFGDFIAGLWLILIGWFLGNAARMSYQQVLVRHVLQGVPVMRLMSVGGPTMRPETTVEVAVREGFMATEQRAFPIVGPTGFVGQVSIDDVRKLPQAQWSTTTVSQIMTPAARLPELHPETDAEQALEALARHDVEQLPVLDDGRVLGVLRQRDLFKWLALQTPHAT